MKGRVEGLTAEEIGEVHALQAQVDADTAAQSRQPRGAPTQEECGGFTLFSWDEQTTSLGVEAWLKERAFDPVTEEDLRVLQELGYPKGHQALVALGRDGNRDFEVAVLHPKDGKARIDRADRVAGSADDLWYPGWDWVPAVVFPAKRKNT